MDDITRREWMAVAGASAAWLATLNLPARGNASEPKGGMIMVKEYSLPALPYAYDALEPYLDKETVTIHHDKHHAGYVKGLNDTLAALDAARAKNDFAAIQALSRNLAFHGSGHVLHTLYFANLSPKPAPPSGALADAIKAQFGSVDTLKAQLKAASNTAAGSGWGILSYEPLGGRLLVLQAERHDNQLIPGAVPLLVVDVWEHAYYLKYQNKRADYLDAVINNIINWKEVEKRFAAVK
jgi:Fe-Mn family superoxide dismutase